jgi:aurora kinase
MIKQFKMDGINKDVDMTKEHKFELPSYLPEDILDNFPNVIGVKYDFVKDLTDSLTSGVRNRHRYYFIINERSTNTPCFLKIYHHRHKEDFVGREEEIHILLENDRHKNIIKCRELHFCPFFNLIILDYHPTDVINLINGGFRFTYKQIFHIFSGLVGAIKYLHSKNILYRDMKPDNVMLNLNPKDVKDLDKYRETHLLEPYLIDFDHSSLDGKESQNYDLDASNVGTDLYRCPEAVFFGEFSDRSDVWGLGYLMHQLVYDSAPFRRDLFLQHIKKERDQEDWYRMVYPNVHRRIINDKLDNLICLMLVGDPAKRISIEDIEKHPWMLDNKKRIEIENKQRVEMELKYRSEERYAPRLPAEEKKT